MTKRKTPKNHGRRGPGGVAKKPAPRGDSAALWLYGRHAVLEALANPRRRARRLLLTPEAATRLGPNLSERRAVPRARGEDGGPTPETAARDQIAAHLLDGAVHQGLALLAEPLAQPALPDLIESLGADRPGRGGPPGRPGVRPLVLLVDQVTDPQNLGAVLRSAAAFGAGAVITTRRHAPPESGALAKAASGALEHVPYVQVGNLARALASLKSAGFWCLGLSGEAAETLADADPGGPLALVLGSEGSGLRRLTRESCDLLARLPTRPPIDTLNVSNAAAVALYELLGRAPRS